MQFRNQALFAHYSSLAVQILVAMSFSLAHGFYWLWICPALLLLMIPKVKRSTWVIVDDSGVHVGDKTSILWAEIEALERRGWARAVFILKTGGRKSLWTTDWPTESQEEFYEFLHKRGLFKPMANLEGTL